MSPSGDGRLYRVPTTPTSSDWQTSSQVHTCLTRSPLDGTRHEDKFIDLAITAQLRTGDQKGAQIVVVNRTMVAKIYDPLYYRDVNDFGKKADVVKIADTDYCHEAAAYNELIDTPLPGNCIPEYYESWVMSVSQGTSSRQVPFILMEFIHGKSMRNTDPKRFTEEERHNIMARALEAEAQVFHHGVFHRDFHPRNILLAPPHQPSTTHSASTSSDFRVVLIDFNIARVFRLMGRVPSKLERSKMLSPAYLQWGHLNGFTVAGWIPWDGVIGTDEKWLWERFEHDDRYVAIRRIEGHPLHCPELVDGNTICLMATIKATASTAST